MAHAFLCAACFHAARILLLLGPVSVPSLSSANLSDSRVWHLFNQGCLFSLAGALDPSVAESVAKTLPPSGFCMVLNRAACILIHYKPPAGFYENADADSIGLGVGGAKSLPFFQVPRGFEHCRSWATV